MAYSYQSYLCRNQAEAFHYWRRWGVVNMGWTNVAQGEGTGGTFNQSGTELFTTVDDWNAATFCWYVVESPSGNVQWLVQMGSSYSLARVYVSRDGTGFTGTGFGTVSETVPPSAADQFQILGTAGGYAGTWAPSNPPWRLFLTANDVATGSGTRYFHLGVMRGLETNGTNRMTMFGQIPVTAPAADADPAVYAMGWTGTTNTANELFACPNDSLTLVSGLTGFGWYASGLIDYHQMAPFTAPNQAPAMPIRVGKTAATAFMKGYISDIRYSWTNLTFPNLIRAGGQDWLRLDSGDNATPVSIPWDRSVTVDFPLAGY